MTGGFHLGKKVSIDTKIGNAISHLGALPVETDRDELFEAPCQFFYKNKTEFLKQQNNRNDILILANYHIISRRRRIKCRRRFFLCFCFE